MPLGESFRAPSFKREILELSGYGVVGVPYTCGTLPPSLVLVKRLFLSGKPISGNILYRYMSGNILFQVIHLLLILTSHVLIAPLPLLQLWVGVIVLMLWHLYAQDCPA